LAAFAGPGRVVPIAVAAPPRPSHTAPRERPHRRRAGQLHRAAAVRLARRRPVPPAGRRQAERRQDPDRSFRHDPWRPLRLVRRPRPLRHTRRGGALTGPASHDTTPRMPAWLSYATRERRGWGRRGGGGLDRPTACAGLGTLVASRGGRARPPPLCPFDAQTAIVAYRSSTAAARPDPTQRESRPDRDSCPVCPGRPLAHAPVLRLEEAQ